MNRAADRAAVVLLSGGLDSATVLAMAAAGGRRCYALSVDYGQRHLLELEAARRVAAAFEVAAHRVVKVDIGQFGGSALTDDGIAVPNRPGTGIPITYVPARNTIMLAIGLGWCEVLDARELHIGVNAIDYSGYPDCRPAFIEQFERLAALATQAGIEGEAISIHAPLIEMTKAEIIAKGVELGVDFRDTVSCYQPDDTARACGACDACRLRREGFMAAGVDDPTVYQTPVD
jgi:7-cyano-7-deazaguanine synthase